MRKATCSAEISFLINKTRNKGKRNSHWMINTHEMEALEAEVTEERSEYFV